MASEMNSLYSKITETAHAKYQNLSCTKIMKTDEFYDFSLNRIVYSAITTASSYLPQH